LARAIALGDVPVRNGLVFGWSDARAVGGGDGGGEFVLDGGEEGGFRVGGGGVAGDVDGAVGLGEEEVDAVWYGRS
jgi:hypothetical protein